MLTKLFQKIEEEGMLPKSHYGVSITLMTKPKDITEKENYRPMALMNIMQKLSRKY